MGRAGILPRFVAWLVKKGTGGSFRVYRDDVAAHRAKQYRSRVTGDCLEPEILEGSELVFALGVEARENDFCLVFDPDETLTAEKLIVKKLVTRDYNGVPTRFLYASDRLPMILLTPAHEIRGVLMFAVIPAKASPVNAEMSARVNAENAQVAQMLEDQRAGRPVTVRVPGAGPAA